MFKVGSKVVYPMQGLGFISSIEEKEFYDGKKSYYTINLLNSTMNIMIPAEKISESNLRSICDLPTLEKIFSALDHDQSYSLEELSQKERYTMNMKKMKSGSLKEEIELVRDLTHINNIKKLNANETQMLTTTRKLIIDEISLVKNITKEQAEDLLDSKIS